ncbi:hypothetical protein BTO06_00570 [Tenacibaculum sp. SZ-18]|uniref:hypothetical protein n=1 Tax=Tenacibaculum sp. SZ-18 TaxID=754423 RepID=UPI000C2D1EF9|nr:hypothetical protein [Tenacibaculum sp. SZ-18]AUC13730.1 hypothetical protein BTO06_00570 [Tenacibaculum sp. SZ-18]
MNLLKNYNKLILVSFILIVGFFGYNYVFKKADTTEDIEISFEGSSKDLLLKLSKSADKLNSKVVLIEGKVSSINDEGIIIDEMVFCQFTDVQSTQKLKESQTVKIKGIIIGYDDLLNELKLNQCILKD